MEDYYLLYKSLYEVKIDNEETLLRFLEDGYNLRGRVSNGVVYDRINTEDKDCIQEISKIANIKDDNGSYYLHIYTSQHPDGYIDMDIIRFGSDQVSVKVTSSSERDPEYKERQEIAKRVLTFEFLHRSKFNHGENAMIKMLRIKYKKE